MKTAARRNRKAGGGERGFALLLVFLMAAVVGISLYAALPRVAIQTQRAKEQMLIERGEQFKRALQLYMRANKGSRRPADIDELDRGYNNMRFLRHRYKDPMTGKDEWRIIHMQAGVLVDSLLNKPKDGDKKESSTLGQNISAQAGLGETANAGQAMPNAMNRRRPSEGGLGGSPGAGAGMGGQPGQPGGSDNGTQPPPTDTANNPISNVPGLPGTPDAANNPAQNQAAVNLIGDMLTRARPGGPPQMLNQGSSMPSGMAGVASTVDSDGLMLYGDRSNYQEWEFTYDPTKDRPRQDPRNMLVGNQMGTPSNSASGAATTSTQAGAFSQPGQPGTGTLTGGSSQPGTFGQNTTNSNTGTGTSSQAGQGGTVDIRPGKR